MKPRIRMSWTNPATGGVDVKLLGESLLRDAAMLEGQKDGELVFVDRHPRVIDRTQVLAGALCLAADALQRLADDGLDVMVHEV